MTVDPTRSRMPAWMPRLNRRIFNRVQGLWAPYLPPYAMIVHRGRRSGASYRSPVVAYRRGATLSIGLLYGSEAQWVKNILAAGGGDVIRAGRRSALTNPRIVTRETATEPLPRIARSMSSRMGVLVCDLQKPEAGIALEAAAEDRADHVGDARRHRR
jgi:deazaflavin-dependent oxidoreductase (nitroreductase family)